MATTCLRQEDCAIVGQFKIMAAIRRIYVHLSRNVSSLQAPSSRGWDWLINDHVHLMVWETANIR